MLQNKQINVDKLTKEVISPNQDNVKKTQKNICTDTSVHTTDSATESKAGKCWLPSYLVFVFIALQNNSAIKSITWGENLFRTLVIFTVGVKITHGEIKTAFPKTGLNSFCSSGALCKAKIIYLFIIFLFCQSSRVLKWHAF